MLLQFPAIVQEEAGVLVNMEWQYLLDERSQLLMSWLKEVAPKNISAHAHTRRGGTVTRRPREGAKRAAEALGGTHRRCSSRRSCPTC